MFAGKGAAVADDEVGSFFNKLAEFGDALFRFQIEVEARMHAGMAEVSVERTLVAIRGHHFAEIAEISAEVFWGDGGVFPTFPIERFARHVRRGTETGLADFPDTLGVGARIDLDVGRCRTTAKRVDH